MKQMAFSKMLTALTCVLMLCALAPTLAVADQAQYIYDDLGRLSQVVDGQGNVATYTYDAVGNLLSIARNTGGVGAPTITALTPNTGILVRNVLTTSTSLTATFQISFAARTGAAAVTVTTT